MEFRWKIAWAAYANYQAIVLLSACGAGLAFALPAALAGDAAPAIAIGTPIQVYVPLPANGEITRAVDNVATIATLGVSPIALRSSAFAFSSLDPEGRAALVLNNWGTLSISRSPTGDHLRDPSTPLIVVSSNGGNGKDGHHVTDQSGTPGGWGHTSGDITVSNYASLTGHDGRTIKSQEETASTLMHGIAANTQGGHGGEGGHAKGSHHGGRGGRGGDAGSITIGIAQGGSVMLDGQGAVGILAHSIGGLGGNAGGGAGAADGNQGGLGGNGGRVSVINSGSIQTSGYAGYGIIALSRGGAGGDAASGGWAHHGVSHDGGRGNSGGVVTVTNDYARDGGVRSYVVN